MTATFFRSRCPTRMVGHDMPPYQVWTDKKPVSESLKVLGCHAYVQVMKQKHSKFDSRSARCRFLGYSEHEKVYRLEATGNGCVMTSHDVRFMEDVFGHVKSSGTVVHQDEASVNKASSQNDETDHDTEDAAPNQDFMLDSTKSNQTQASLDVDIEPGSKLHQRN